jgi:23S rRNA (uracil1939-C5)-methyltransferase
MQIIELFSGLGNFTLPLASLGHKVTAYEVNEVALQSFKVTTASLPSLTRNINFLQSNLYQDKALPSLQGFDLLFVDPPRSGLKGLLPHMASHAENERPKNLIYVSCFAESMASDLRALSELGYKLTALSGVDQFPNTPHCEWIARLER